jgi:hypothetical protein
VADKIRDTIGGNVPGLMASAAPHFMADAETGMKLHCDARVQQRHQTNLKIQR